MITYVITVYGRKLNFGTANNESEVYAKVDHYRDLFGDAVSVQIIK